MFLDLTKDFNTLRRLIKAHGASLSVAAKKGDLVFCKLLLCDGAIVDMAGTRNKALPLHTAASRGHVDICNLLLYFGASVHKVDGRDKTPLFVAAEAGHEDVCNLLEHYGADISCMEKEIEPLLAINSSPEMKKLLLRWKDKLQKMSLRRKDKLGKMFVITLWLVI